MDMKPQDFTNPLYEGLSAKLTEDVDGWPIARRASSRREGPFSSKKMADRQNYRAVRMHVTNRARIKALQSGEFCDNKLVTSKYKITTFLPVNLFQQFSNAVNLYFLLISVIQLIPGLSPTGVETTLVPLLFVLLINASKEAYYDYEHHKSDAEVNSRKSEVLLGGGLKSLEWSSIIVGDIIRVHNNSEIPADLLFLSSSDPQGMAYLETTNLDGETKFKIRNSFYQSSTMSSEDGDVSFHGLSGLVIECEQPNDKVHEFEGFVSFQGQGLMPLDISQILLRGATLRNTEWVVGAVVFTGTDTKYMRTMVPLPTKVSHLERKMNVLVSGLFVYQLILCLGLAIGHFMWTERNLHHFYLAADYVWPEPGLDLPGLLVQLLRFLILLSSVIPISLYITLELVKIIQCCFIRWDIRMLYKPTGDPAKARTLNLNEELGQVHDVLLDKTGTLTENAMTFVQCSINGVIYGDFTRETFWEESKSDTCIHTICEDEYLMEELKKTDAQPNSQSQKCKDFFLHLAICHTAIPTYADVEETGEIIYQSSSPDEEALVKGAAICGFQLTGRDSDMLTTEFQGQIPEAHTILAVLEFTSERKRMSIICRNSSGRIKLYCKGADSMILKRLAKDQGGIAETSLKHMEQFAHAGYRTLCIAEREIDEDEFEKWAYQFRAASVALDDREEKLAEATDSIERDMILLGVTAVEDKLQNGVKESVTLLAQAGIKLWVLTGDKLETSVAVALSCNLLTDSMHIFLLCESSSNSVPQMLHNMLDEARQLTHTRTSEDPAEMAVIIEGDALAAALEENNRTTFLQLCRKCRTVLCCRVSPLQKALVTQMVKENNLTVTLGIGDGANDVAMIRTAHIGVGISGREGNAAILASDYSIGQFRYLTRLLLIHGRWSYKRNKLLVMYVMYKNIVCVMGQCYFAFYSGISAESLYPNVLLATYNLLWTFLPIFALSTLDQDVSQHTVLSNPQLYKETQKDDIQTFFTEAGCWFLSAIWHSIVVFFFPLASTMAIGKYGAANGIFHMGVSSYTLAVVIVNLKIMSCTNNVTAISMLCVWVMSIVNYLLFLLLLSYMGLSMAIFDELSDVGRKVCTSEAFWMVLVVGVVSAFLPGWAISTLRRQISPADFQVLRETESCESTGARPPMVGSPECDQRELQ